MHSSLWQYWGNKKGSRGFFIPRIGSSGRISWRVSVYKKNTWLFFCFKIHKTTNILLITSSDPLQSQHECHKLITATRCDVVHPSCFLPCNNQVISPTHFFLLLLLLLPLNTCVIEYFGSSRVLCLTLLPMCSSKIKLCTLFMNNSFWFIDICPWVSGGGERGEEAL